ncbi:MAG: LptA/OstA family protein, partial [Victivallaceae bacterium]
GEKITINQKQEEFNVERGCVLTIHNMSADGKAVAVMNNKNTVPTILTCDFVDFKYGQNVGYFTGSVKINDPKLYLTGDKMTVHLFDKKVADASAKLNPAQFNPLSSGSKGVKLVEFDGNVSVCQKDEQGSVNLQRQAQSGKLVYNMVDEIITLTKDNPLITYNSATVAGDEIIIYPQQEQMTLPRGVNIKNNGDATVGAASGITAKQGNLNYGGNKMIFVGDVKVRNSQLNADAGKMIIYLKEMTDKTAKKEDKSTASSGDLFGSMMKQ